MDVESGAECGGGGVRWRKAWRWIEVEGGVEMVLAMKGYHVRGPLVQWMGNGHVSRKM